MKPSHLSTPRTLSETSFVTGYVSVRPMAYREFTWEKAANYATAVVIGFSLAAVLVVWWSS